MNVDAATRRESALSTLANVIVAPGAAFDSIRESPRWFVAFVVTCALGIAGLLLSLPEAEHAVTSGLAAQFASDPNLSALTPDKQQQALGFARSIARFSWVFIPLVIGIAALASALLFLIVTAVAKGSAGFARLFAFAVNVSVVTFGIGSLLRGVIAAIRGPQAFNSQLDLLTALPSLAWVAPSASPKVIAFLSGIDPLTIWSFFLVAFGMTAVARVPRGAGYAAGAIVTLCSCLYYAVTAR